MKNLKNQTVIVALLFFAVVSIAAVIPTKQNPPLFKNLKILPKNISQAKLDSIMDKYNYALGVSYNFSM